MSTLPKNSDSSDSTQSIPSVEELMKASHMDLLMLRSQVSDPNLQAFIAPFEHRAYARERAQEAPIQSALSFPFLIPAYAALKALGIQKARTKPSLEQVIQGFAGLAEGLKNTNSSSSK